MATIARRPLAISAFKDLLSQIHTMFTTADCDLHDLHLSLYAMVAVKTQPNLGLVLSLFRVDNHPGQQRPLFFLTVSLRRKDNLQSCKHEQEQNPNM